MGWTTKEAPMQDLGLIAVVVVFFALSMAFARLCERLR
jgi:hypothetical protein